MKIELVFIAIYVLKVTGQLYDQLFLDLFKNRSRYVKQTIPAVNTTSAVSVEMSVSLLQVEDVSTRYQYIKLQTWMKMTWKDMRLRWDPQHYDNVRSIRIPATMLWQPDITLINSPTGVRFSRVPIILSYDGLLTHVRPTTIKSPCTIDKYRPHDSFACKLKLGSWVFDGQMLDLKQKTGNSGFDMSLFLQSPHYAVISTNSSRNVEHYSCCEDPFVDITYEITIKRKKADFENVSN